ncbi:hypothetical protein AB0L43_30045, partial [Micromonospora globbae]
MEVDGMSNEHAAHEKAIGVGEAASPTHAHEGHDHRAPHHGPAPGASTPKPRAPHHDHDGHPHPGAAHQGGRVEAADGHDGHHHPGHGGHAGHGGHGGHDKHAGHDPEQFRRKFWLSLALTLPIVATSHMV